jgi:PAS domain S-box-containing protein
MPQNRKGQKATTATVGVAARTVSPQRDNNLPDARLDTMTAFFERSGMCMSHLDAGLRIREANQEFCQQFGLSAPAARGSSIFGFVHSSSHERLRHQFARALDGHHIRVAERVLGLRKGHTTVPGRLTAVMLDNAHGVGSLVVLFEPDEPPASAATTAADARLLTALDARILEGIASGVSTIELASTCYLSRQGIEYRVGMMLRRMRVPNRVALVSKAYSLGVLSVGVWPPHVPSECVDQRSGQRSQPRPLDFPAVDDQECATGGHRARGAGIR